MPPCKTVLLLHIQRANFQTLIWRNALISNFELPKPENNGWTIGCTGSLEIKWFGDSFLPKELQDILSDDIYSEEEGNESESLSNSSGDKEEMKQMMRCENNCWYDQYHTLSFLCQFTVSVITITCEP